MRGDTMLAWYRDEIKIDLSKIETIRLPNGNYRIQIKKS